MSSSIEPLFPQALLDALRNSPGRPAFEHGSRIVSCGEVLETIRRVGSGMRSVGLGPGRGVAMVISVSPEAFAAHMAAHVLGCRVVGVRPGWSRTQLASVLGAQIDAVVADPPSVTPQLVELTGPATVVSLGASPAAADLLTYADNGRPVTAMARADDIAMLTFTSGSTGQPKGCAQTYRALSEDVIYQPARWTPAVTRLATCFERGLVFGTLASSVVMTFLGLCLLGRGTAVIPDEDPRPLFPYTIERHRITGAIITVPRLYQMLDVLQDDVVDVTSLRALMVSGSPGNPRRFAAAVDRLGPVLWQGYGQSEAGMISLLTPEEIAQWPADALTSVGRPHPAVEVSVRDHNDQPVSDGETGEIWVRSRHMMVGYWGEPGETAEVLRDGWLRTRDLGYLDGRGFLHLTGRTRDVIMVNAEVCYAGPIERVLASHPDVGQAYVVGAPDEQTGEAIHAFVVPSGDRTPDHKILARLVRAELGAASVPKTITAVPDVPLAPSGKPDKRALMSLHHRPAADKPPP